MSELGIDDRKVSHRAQRIAAVPEARFERYIATATEITTADVLRIAKTVGRERTASSRRGSGGWVTDLERFTLAGHRVGTIYADPPWLYANQGTRAATRNHYLGMTVEQLCALPISDIAAGHAHLHIWTTNAFLFECPKIIAARGFEFRSSFIWIKPQIGIGNYWRNAHEFLLTGVRGDAKAFDDQNLRSWLEADRRQHSEKPDEVRRLIERASPGPRIELFARNLTPGWYAWGHQITRPLLSQHQKIIKDNRLADHTLVEARG